MANSRPRSSTARRTTCGRPPGNAIAFITSLTEPSGMDRSSRPAMLLVVGRSIGLAASFAIGIVLARLFDPAVFGTYKQFFLVYATLYGVLQLGMAESLYRSEERRVGKECRSRWSRCHENKHVPETRARRMH